MSLINFANAGIEILSVHWVGNQTQGEPLLLSSSPQQLYDDKVRNRLLQFFLHHFRDRIVYGFKGSPGLNSNPMYHLSDKLLDTSGEFHKHSQEIAAYLYGVSTHHWIKSCECWVARFSNIIYSSESKPVEAIGVFKTELKEEFLTVKRSGDGFSISLEEGFNIKKLDKGCLVINTNAEKDYEILIIDNINLNDPAEYWKEKFLKVKPLNNAYLNTTHELKILKAFLDDNIPQEDRLEKIERMNNSVLYMKDNDHFNLRDFESSVFPEKQMRNSFNEYRNQYKYNMDVEIEDEYEIEKEIMRNPKKYIRSVIKLDKDFHIYIHGSRNNISRGYDQEKGMKYYQIFFNEES